MSRATITALEASLRASPEDWDGWRVYADWLTEQGDARGPHVMLEHRLATTELSEEEQAELRRRIDRQFQAHRSEWLAGWVAPKGVKLKWRYGFVRSVKLPWRPGTIEILEALRTHPDAWFLAELDLDGPAVGDEGAAAIAATPALRSFVSLNLSEHALTDAGAIALAGSEQLDALRELRLCSNRIGFQGAEALIGSGSLRSLVRLDLYGNPFRSKEKAALQGRRTASGGAVCT